MINECLDNEIREWFEEEANLLNQPINKITPTQRKVNNFKNKVRGFGNRTGWQLPSDCHFPKKWGNQEIYEYARQFRLH